MIRIEASRAIPKLIVKTFIRSLFLIYGYSWMWLIWFVIFGALSSGELYSEIQRP